MNNLNLESVKECLTDSKFKYFYIIIFKNVLKT